jgi:hypothetical protein
MTSIDDAIFLMDDEVIDNININTKTAKKPKFNKKDKHTESTIVIAKSLPIDIIKPIINNSIVEYRGVPKVSPPEGGLTLASNAGSNSTIIVPATL